MKLNETQNPQCKCGGNSRKNGHHKTATGSHQRYECLNCGSRFLAEYLPPATGLRTATDKVALVVQLLCEGMGVRATSRVTGISKPTVLKILAFAGAKAEAIFADKVKNVPVGRLEIDEVYGFVGCLQQNTAGREDNERGEQYAYLAIDADTKLILAVHVGKRDAVQANHFLCGVKDAVAGRFQMTSDGFNAYREPVWGVASVFGSDIDYATEIKTYGRVEQRYASPVQCLTVKREARIGNPDMDAATVNHAERTNLSVRLFNRRFTRKTLGYSKKLENHRWSVLLQAAHFNFCRVHSAIGKTPAMAAGITDRPWDAADLLR